MAVDGRAWRLGLAIIVGPVFVLGCMDAGLGAGTLGDTRKEIGLLKR